jgi:ribosomal protein S18 acetylase RimI-like enzyme
MISYKIKKPTSEEFSYLRNSVGWNLEEGGISKERASDSIERSPLCICAYDENNIIGMIRISGDVSMYGYIQDTIVIPSYSGKGIGTEMLKRVLIHLEGRRGYLLGVCPSKVSVKFYEKMGFKKRPEDPNGFMNLEIN